MKENLCNSQLIFPENYQKRKIDRDLPLIHLINTVFESESTLGSFDSRLRALNKKFQIAKAETANGLIKVTRLAVRGYYVRIELTIEHIDSIIYRKKCLLDFSTFGRCSTSGYRVLDIQLIKKFYVPIFRFPITVSDYLNVVSVDFNVEKLKMIANNQKESRLSLPNPQYETWVNQILLNQYNSDSSCCYPLPGNANVFLMLVRKGEIAVLKELLFSPNYFFALNSMEALIYLNSVNQVVFDESMKRRIEAIKTANYPVVMRRGTDMYITVNGYKELSTNDELIIYRYRNSLQ